MEEPARLEDARVVVVGGGIGGVSVLYHLARAGLSDALLLEQSELSSGSTWHAAGLCTQYNASLNLVRVLKQSLDTYSSLEDETGRPVDLRRCGSLRLALHADGLDEFRARRATAELAGVPFEIVGPDRAAELFPLLDPEGVHAAAYLPTDGHADPSSIVDAFAAGARALGARIARHTRVTAIERTPRGWRLETTRGPVGAEVVVNAAGQWAREVGRLAGIELPLVSLSHQYLITEDLEAVGELDRELPVLRDPGASFYARQDGRGLLVGPFEREPSAWGLDGIPRGFSRRLLRPDLGRIADDLEAAGRRIPALVEAPVKRVIHGPDAYTPDGRCLLGPVPGVRDFHVVAGFSIFGIVFGGGAGRLAAEWIAEGQPSVDVWELDVRRFGDYARRRYTVERAREAYAREYAIVYPEQELPAGRPLKTSALYDRLSARGAVYGARFGWERPLWFARGRPASDEYSFRRPSWNATVGEECRATRSAVGVLDQTSFAKFEVSGAGAEAYLDRLCANALPAETGRIALTQLCTPAGGIECDVTVTRLTEARFYVVSAAATEGHDHAWLERHLPEDGSVRLENVTGRDGVLTLAGPRSRELLARLAGEDVSGESFPFFSARSLEVAGLPVLALRLSFVGELGYELHHPLAYQRSLYERLLETGADLGLLDFGYRALESMRLEKAYRLWGADLSADFSPLEAGLGRLVCFDKGEFVGREALLRERERGVRRTLALLAVDTADCDPYRYEPVFEAGRTVGYVTSGGFGHTLGTALAFSYLPPSLAEPGTELEVELLGVRRPSRVVAQPPYDPGSERLLG